MIPSTQSTLSSQILGHNFPGLEPLQDHLSSQEFVDISHATRQLRKKKGKKGGKKKPKKPTSDSFGDVFETTMELLGEDYTWENITEDTPDGYSLTLFTITGDEDGNPVEKQGEKGPVLLMHGLTLDSRAWFNKSVSGDSLSTQLTKEGYQVYFGNVRGTPDSRSFSNGNDAVTNEQAYWDFSVTEIGENDVQTMVKKVYQDYAKRFDGDCRKVQLVGHSLGTVEILIALSASDKAENYVSHGVLIAPCPIPSNASILGLSYGEVAGLLALMNSRDIWSFFGPNWADQVENDFCECGNPPTDATCLAQNNLANTCPLFEDFNVGPVADGTADSGSYDEIGTKLLRHIGQLFETERFQDYSDTLQENTLYPVENITVPLTVAYSDVDTTCPYENQTDTLDRVPTIVDSTLFSGASHFELVGNNAEPNMAFLIDALDNYDRKKIRRGDCKNFDW